MRSTSIIRILAIVLGSAGTAVAATDEPVAGASSWTESERKRGFVAFPFSSLKLLSDTDIPSRPQIERSAGCALARGEYESMQFGVRALTQDLKDIKIEIDCELPATVYHQRPEALTPYAQQYGWFRREGLLLLGDTIAELKENRTSSFWLTVRADNQVAAGIHNAAIRITAHGRTAVDLKARIRV